MTADVWEDRQHEDDEINSGLSGVLAKRRKMALGPADRLDLLLHSECFAPVVWGRSAGSTLRWGQYGAGAMCMDVNPLT